MIYRALDYGEIVPKEAGFLTEKGFEKLPENHGSIGEEYRAYECGDIPVVPITIPTFEEVCDLATDMRVDDGSQMSEYEAIYKATIKLMGVTNETESR